jgi:glucose-6-phosphate-specific signal transduction histidine kinase
MDALKALKNQLRAKKLSGRSLHKLLDVATDELRFLEQPIEAQWNRDLDETQEELRRLQAEDQL